MRISRYRNQCRVGSDYFVFSVSIPDLEVTFIVLRVGCYKFIYVSYGKLVVLIIFRTP